MKYHDLDSIAFPCISTGVYGFPKKLAAQIAIKTCLEIQGNRDCPKIIFCCFGTEDRDFYREICA